MKRQELVTQQTKVKFRIDRPIQIQLSVGSDALILHFNVSTLVEEEEFGEYFDSDSPLMIPVSEIENELESIFNKALQMRSEQIEGKTIVNTTPDYKSFYSALLGLDIFRIAQQLSATQLEANVAYMDAGIVLGNAISGAENKGALQAAFDRLLLVLDDAVTDEHRQQLQDAIDANAIPLKLQKETLNEAENNI
ncbi:hypothetical protein QT972_00175 [Microcoleus sp. herbarium7]|uniref:hypothetical protein n=1 Tax=Microcoleus sp. herbarium7 TaxID=3055435 RepID=UPI002FCFFDEF